VSAVRATRRLRGFTLIELLVVVVAIGILAGVLLDRVLPLIGRAQRAAFLQVQADLKTALLLEAAKRITRGEAAELTTLSDANPMTLLLTPPANYLGSFSWPPDGDVPRASWYFDEHSHRLVYLVGRYTRFDPLDGPRGRIELRTEFVFEDRDHDGSFDPVRDEFEGLRLAPVHAYAWPD
jgi:prepilin-type N-terminal cleavage/methylation domain-containing protein